MPSTGTFGCSICMAPARYLRRYGRGRGSYRCEKHKDAIDPHHDDHTCQEPGCDKYATWVVHGIILTAQCDDHAPAEPLEELMPLLESVVRQIDAQLRTAEQVPEGTDWPKLAGMIRETIATALESDEECS